MAVVMNGGFWIWGKGDVLYSCWNSVKTYVSIEIYSIDLACSDVMMLQGRSVCLCWTVVS